MANVIGEFVAKIGANTKGFTKGVDKAETKMGGFAKTVKRHGKAIAVAFAAMGAAVVAVGVKAIQTFAKMGDEVQKMALRTGFSTEALSELRFAAEQSGASLASLEKAVKRQSKAITDAADGLLETKRAFDRLGLSAEELINLKAEDAFFKIASALGEMENETLRAATAQDVFGRAGTQLLPLIAQGADGIARLRQEAHDLGIVFDQETANSAAILTDAMNTLNQSVNGVKIAFAKDIAPELASFLEWVSDIIIAAGKLKAANDTWGKTLDSTSTRLKTGNMLLDEKAKWLKGESNILAELISEYPQIALWLGIITEEQRQLIFSFKALHRGTFEGIDALLALGDVVAEVTDKYKHWGDIQKSVSEEIAGDIAKQQTERLREFYRDAFSVIQKGIEGTRIEWEKMTEAERLATLGLDAFFTEASRSSGGVSRDTPGAQFFEGEGWLSPEEFGPGLRRLEKARLAAGQAEEFTGIAPIQITTITNLDGKQIQQVVSDHQGIVLNRKRRMIN